MIRFPSLVHVISSARKTVERFPWVLLSALASAGLAWFLVVRENTPPALEELLSRWLLVSMLGISTFAALAVALERSRLAPHRHWIGLAAGILLLVVFFFTYKQDLQRIYLYRFFQLAVASHLLVAVSPFYRRGGVVSFWQFNRLLFQRILQAILFSTILFAGLSLALWAIQSLLNLKVDWRAYYFLFLTISFVFNTWFFLAGIPSKCQDLESEADYPVGLRLFVQFILLPLVTLYVLILYAYLAKVVAIREWPHGTIGWLVSIVSAFGMLALLLVHPLRDQPGHRWIYIYSRAFYAGLFPLIVLLLMAIWRRVSEYGVTEDRYFLITLSLWMTGIAGYLTFRRQPSVKVIPVSLASVALLTLSGPWGAYSVSRENQLDRLEGILGRVGILKAGRAQKASSTPEFKDRKEISAIVTYLLQMHGTASLQKWFAQDLDSLPGTPAHSVRGSLFSTSSSIDQAAKVTELMGLAYVLPWEYHASSKDFYASPLPHWQEPRVIAGYDYLSQFSIFRTDARAPSQPVNIGSRHFELVWSADGQAIEFREAKGTLVTLAFGPFLDQIRKNTGQSSNAGLSPNLLSLEGESDSIKVRLIFESLSGTRDSSGIQLKNGHGELLLKFKEAAK